MITTGPQLKAARDAAGYSVADAAYLLGISTRSLRRFELWGVRTGGVEPPERVCKVAEDWIEQGRRAVAYANGQSDR